MNYTYTYEMFCRVSQLLYGQMLWQVYFSQDKVYEELKEIFQDSDRSPNMKDLQDMKYLQMVIKEALRILPSVPSIGRQTSRDMQLGNIFNIINFFKLQVVIAQVAIAVRRKIQSSWS